MYERKIPLDEINFKKLLFPVIIALIVLLAIVFRPFALVPAGSRGVIFNQFKGVVKDRVLMEGIHLIIPGVETVSRIEVRVQKQDFQAASASKDLQEVKVSLAVNYHLDPLKVADIFQQVGVDYESKLISPGVQESIKAVAAMYNATELISKRPEVKEKVVSFLRGRLSGYHIVIDDVSITDFNFSPKFTEAIEAKQVAEQEALKKQYELQKAEQEASIEVARAEGEKKAIIARAQGQAEAQKLLKVSVSPELIRLKEVEAQMMAINKWDGKMPSVTGGTIPMLNLGDAVNK